MDHLKQIAEKVKERGLDAMLVSSAPGESYAVGFHGEGFVVVSGKECRYYTDSRYIEAAEKTVTGASITMMDRKTSYRALIQQAVEELGIGKLGFEDGYMTVKEYKTYSSALSCEMVPAQEVLSELRASKDQEEVERMIKAQRISERAFEEILKFIKPGVTEKEVAAKLTYDMLRFGAEKMSFDPIVASGPNGSLPHAVPTEKKIASGEFVTMDFGCVYQGYCSDMTRTVAVGEPTEEMRKVYETVLAAQEAGIAAEKGGMIGREVDAAARKVIEDAGYGAYFGHSFGHSVGLEIHEGPNASPSEERPIPVGAAVSAEPGIYLPGRFGVRIEDVTVFTAEGCTDITKAPKNLIIL